MDKSQESLTESYQISQEKQKVALVHDFLTAFGGAERVLQDMARLYPEAPIFTLLSDDKITAKHFSGRVIHTSWLAKLPRFFQARPRLLLLLFPAAIESFDLREYDLVISSSGAWSKGLVTRLHTSHIAYLHSPMRFAWDKHQEYLTDLGLSWGFRNLGRIALSYLRVWDYQAADRPDILLANSLYTKKRIEKYYRKTSTVVYPVVKAGSIQEEVLKREYFLVVSRLTKAKKIDLVIEALNKLGLPLRVVGTGAEEESLKRLAGPTVTFEGSVGEDELARLYAGARALIIPSEEDFGLVAGEALSYGTPVIAYGKGGVREIVTDGIHGVFFEAPLPEILGAAILRFLNQEPTFVPEILRQRAGEFSEKRFQEGLYQAAGALNENRSEEWFLQKIAK